MVSTDPLPEQGVAKLDAQDEDHAVDSISSRKGLIEQQLLLLEEEEHGWLRIRQQDRRQLDMAEARRVTDPRVRLIIAGALVGIMALVVLFAVAPYLPGSQFSPTSSEYRKLTIATAGGIGIIVLAGLGALYRLRSRGERAVSLPVKLPPGEERVVTGLSKLREKYHQP